MREGVMICRFRHHLLPLSIAALLLCLMPDYDALGRELKFINEHWPPYIIVNEDGSAGGIDAEILQAMAGQLNLRLRFESFDWIYCLRMMEHGRADIISAILKRPERQVYLHYIEPPYLRKSTKLFYLKKSSPHSIKQYEDLYGLRIGVLKGSAYFERFDNDASIQKTATEKTEQLLKMLKSGRLDAVIGTKVVMEHIIQTKNYTGLFKRSAFRHLEETPFYLAISKKSVFADDLVWFNEAMQLLIETGKVQAILEKYGAN